MVNPVLYRVAPTSSGQCVLQEFLKFEGTPVNYVNAPGAAGINVNGIVVTADGRYLIIGKRNENMLFRVDLKSREIVPMNMPAEVLNTPDGLFLHKLPDEYGYVASEWSGRSEVPIVLLERIH